MQRRNFVKFLALSPALLGANNLDSSDFHANSTNLNSLSTKGIASIIDLDKCDGCENLPTPACVSACKTKNAHRFPEPIEKIPEYFPRKVKEDYSKNRDDITRLTPYNFTFIERVKVGDKAVSIPRRCMHCDDKTQKMGRPHLNLNVPNFINDDSALVKSVLFAPVAGLVAGAIAVAKSKKQTTQKD